MAEYKFDAVLIGAGAPTSIPEADVSVPVRVAFLRQIAPLLGRKVKITITVEEAADQSEQPAVPMQPVEGRQQ